MRHISLASVLIGIIVPVAMNSKPIDWNRALYMMALTFTFVWAVYSIILFVYAFLVEGRIKGHGDGYGQIKDPN